MSRIIVPVLITFAVIGFAVVLITDPLKLLRTIVIAGIFLAVFYLIYKFLFQKNTAKTDSKYQRAAKQSRKLQQQRSKNRQKPSHLKVIKASKKHLSEKRSTNKKNRSHNLTVIDGKKTKKKNRALF